MEVFKKLTLTCQLPNKKHHSSTSQIMWSKWKLLLSWSCFLHRWSWRKILTNWRWTRRYLDNFPPSSLVSTLSRRKNQIYWIYFANIFMYLSLVTKIWNMLLETDHIVSNKKNKTRVGEESLSYLAKATPNKFSYNCGEEKRDGQVEGRLHLWNRAFGINIFYCNSEEKIISYLYA